MSCPVADPVKPEACAASGSRKQLRDYAEKAREEPNAIKGLGTTLGIAGNSAYWKLCRIRHSFHAKQHIFDVAKAIYGHDTDLAAQWGKLRRDELDRHGAGPVVAALRQQASACDEARKNLDYFTTNRARMAYPAFRARGLCVSTGVVEGACKSVIGNRLKRGGMHWTVDGANAIIALRCALHSNRFDDYWERQASRS